MKRVYTYYKRIKGLKENFLGYYYYMEPGEYIFDDFLKFIHKNNSLNSNKVKYNLQNNKSKPKYYKIKRMIKDLFFNGTIKIKPTNTKIDFAGTVYLASNNGTKDAKIFDFNRDKVMTVYSNIDNFDKKLSTYEYYNKSFMLPKILYKDRANRIIIEEFIRFKPDKDWNREDYLNLEDKVLNVYFKYLEKCRKGNDYCLQILRNTNKNNSYREEYLNRIIKDIDNNLIEQEIPFVRLHGDLWAANVLLCETDKLEPYFIDWEHDDSFIFFYDLLWFMKDEAICNNNLIPLKKYIIGQYDKYLDGLFDIFNLKYVSSLKLDYIGAFYINVMNARGINKKYSKIIYNEYIHLLHIIDKI